MSQTALIPADIADMQTENKNSRLEEPGGLRTRGRQEEKTCF